MEARLARLQGNFDEAEEEYGEVLYRAPVDIQARLGRGMSRLGKGDLEGARADFEAVTFLAPEYGDAWLGLARLLGHQGDSAGARAALERASKLSVEESKTLLASAWLHGRVGEQEDAHRALVAAIEVGADPDQVAELWNMVFSQDPDSPEVQQRRQRSDFWDQRKLPEALRKTRDGEEWEIEVGREWRHYDQAAGYQVTDKTRIVRKREGRSLALEHLDRDRFGRRDNGVAVEMSRKIQEGTYARARVQVTAEAEVLPKLEYSASIRREVGREWQAEVGVRHSEVPGEDLDAFHFELGRVFEDWYLRYRGTLIPYLGSTAGQHSLWARRYLDQDPDHFLELGISGGEVVTEAGAGPTMVRQDATELELRYQHFFSSRFGMFALGTLGNYDRLPDYRGIMLGLLVRWW